MNQLGPWAILQALDLVHGKSSHNSGLDVRQEDFGWGRPQRFSIARIIADQRRGMRGHIDVISLDPSRARRPLSAVPSIRDSI